MWERLKLMLQLTKYYSRSKRARKNERVFTSLQNNRRANVFMWRMRPYNWSHNIWMQKAEKRDRQNKKDGNTNKEFGKYQKGTDKKTLQGIYKIY